MKSATRISEWLAPLACLLAGCASFPRDRSTTADVVRLIHPSRAEIERAIDEQGVRTVVNFRGFEPSQSWYRDQVELCRSKNVRHVDARVTIEGPNREEVIALLELFHKGPKPIALCDGWNGVQSGFAKGLYRLAILGEGKEAARSELPFWQSHQAPFPSMSELDQFFVDWRDEREFYASYRLPRKALRRPGETALVPAERVNMSSAPGPLPERFAASAQSQAVSIGNETEPAIPRRLDSPQLRRAAIALAERRAGSGWTAKQAGINAWKWIMNDRGPNLVSTDRDGLIEAGTIRDYRAMIGDAPAPAGPRLWSAASTEPTPRRVRSPEAFEPMQATPAREVVPAAGWTIEPPRPRREPAGGIVRLGLPVE